MAAHVVFSVKDGAGEVLAADAAGLVQVKQGSAISFVIEVADAVAGTSYSAELKRDGAAGSGFANKPVTTGGIKFDVASVVGADHGGKWTAKVSDSAGTALPEHSVTLNVKAAPADQPAPTEVPGQYDSKFAKGVAAGLVAAFLAVSIPMLLVLIDRQKSDVPVVWVLAFGLFVAGLLLGVLGAFFVALEVRGKLLSAGERTQLSARGLSGADAASIVEAVGKLRGPTAVLVLSAVCLIGSAWIGYGSTRPDSPATPPTETTVPGDTGD